MSPKEIAEAAAERRDKAPHLSLGDFLLEKGLLHESPVELERTSSLPERIGEFDIVREVGRGGMGIVYEAIQQPLGRRVALKVLPPGTASHGAQSERFTREARAIARLQHPNIVTVHASGICDGWQYIAMDLIDGPSVEALLDHGPFEAEQAALIVRSIAIALETAHDAGLVHRDVKPSNILLDGNGSPKLTDFGLVHDPDASKLTLSAAVLGTPAFMSPEQARGEPPRREHDVYSLGAVLYAMLAGRAPYEGCIPSAVLAQLLSGPPGPLVQLRPDVPPALAAICERALSRSTATRYSTSRAFAEDLSRYLDGVRTVAEVQATRSRSLRWMSVLGGSLLAVVAVTIVGRLVTGIDRAPETRAEPVPDLRPIKRITALPGLDVEPSLSPDGSWVAYSSMRDGDFDVYYDRVGLQRPENLTLDSQYSDTQPAVSPSGKEVAFRSERSGGGIFVIDLDSRATRQVTDFGYHPNWAPDGKMLAISTEQIVGVGRSPRNLQSEVWLVDVTTGSSTLLVAADAVQPAWSPRGERLAFWGTRGTTTGLWTVDSTGGDLVFCASDAGSVRDPTWLASGESILVTSRTSGASDIRAIPIDERTGNCGRGRFPIARSLSEAQQSASASRDGRYLALVSWERAEGAVRILARSGAANRPQAVTGDTRVESSPDLSPDGSWLALSVQDGPSDLVLVRTDNSDRRNLTQDNFEERTPRWSPDGQWIAFAANRTGNFEIWRMRPDGTGAERLTETTDGSALSPVWSPDGSRLVYGVRGQGILEIDPSTPAPRAARIVLPASRLKDPESVPRAWSPDGRLLLLVGRDRNATLLDLQSRRRDGTARKGTGRGLDRIR